MFESIKKLSIAVSTMLAVAGSVQAAEPVTVDTFVRAETDRTMAAYVDQGGFGKFLHIRQPTPIDKQDVIRMNRDTLYSIAVFDLTNPVTITLPDSDGRYLSALIINQDHSMLPMEYAPGEFTLTQDLMGTRYSALHTAGVETRRRQPSISLLPNGIAGPFLQLRYLLC